MSSQEGNHSKTLALENRSTNIVEELVPEMSIPSSSVGEWSKEESEWIRLYHELIFTLAAAPSAPLVFIGAGIAHAKFQQHFDILQLGDSETPTKYPKRTLQEFASKRDELVPGLLYRVNCAIKVRFNESKHPAKKGPEVTPEMLLEYQNIRAKLGIDIDISYPERYPLLWQFLSTELSKQYCGHEASTWGQPKARATNTGSASPSREGSTVSIMPSIRQTGAVTESSQSLARVGAESSADATAATTTHAKRTAGRMASAMTDHLQGPPAKKTATVPKIPGQAAPTRKKINTPWTKHELNTLYCCINKFCRKKGVSNLSANAVVKQCTTEINTLCAKEPHGQTRSKSTVERKIHHLMKSQSPKYLNHPMKALVARAVQAKKAIENGEELDKAIEFPQAALPMEPLG